MFSSLENFIQFRRIFFIFGSIFRELLYRKFNQRIFAQVLNIFGKFFTQKTIPPTYFKYFWKTRMFFPSVLISFKKMFTTKAPREIKMISAIFIIANVIHFWFKTQFHVLLASFPFRPGRAQFPLFARWFIVSLDFTRVFRCLQEDKVDIHTPLSSAIWISQH